MDRGAPALRVERLPDAAAFVERAGAFLEQREAENGLILGLCADLRTGRSFGPRAPYFAVATPDGRVAGAAMRTPPFNLILAAGTHPEALPTIAEGVRRSEVADLPGVVGVKELSGPFAAHWRELTGMGARVKMAERIYRLTKVKAPRFGPAPGWMRLAEARDRDLVAGWMLGFTREALGEGDVAGAEANADHWIAGRHLRLWIDGSRPVSMAGASGPTPHGIRVGAVFTPPELRKRGYAGTLVATLSQAELSAGRTFCFLYTDLGNPTSNKIYQDIGYEPVCDVDEYRFEAAT